MWAKVLKRPLPEPEGKEEEAKSERSDDKDDKERAVNELKRELSSSLISIRTEVGRLAQQVTALAGADAEAAAQPAAGELGRFEDTRALRKVIESLEQRMTRKLTQIDERLARGPRAKSGPPKYLFHQFNRSTFGQPAKPFTADDDFAIPDVCKNTTAICTVSPTSLCDATPPDF